MSKIHIKKDDSVIVLSGADKGKTGKVLKVLVDKDRALVEGVRVVTKSTKPSAKSPQGGIVKQESPIHISNLSLIDPKSGKPTRISIKKDGKNVIRVSKKSGEEIK
ncbi:MAG: 50S ribosomal protein L24 [Prevotella sp.]